MAFWWPLRQDLHFTGMSKAGPYIVILVHGDHRDDNDLCDRSDLIDLDDLGSL